MYTGKMSGFLATCQTETNTSNVVVVCRFILVDKHQFSPKFKSVHLMFIIQRNSPAYIQGFNDLLLFVRLTTIDQLLDCLVIKWY